MHKLESWQRNSIKQESYSQNQNKSHKNIYPFFHKTTPFFVLTLILTCSLANINIKPGDSIAKK